MALTDSFAFQQHPRNFCNHRTHLPILSSSTNENQSCEIGSSRTTRRSFLQDASAAVTILLSGAAFTQPAEASYSAYTHREEDWKAREENGGEILYLNSLCYQTSFWPYYIFLFGTNGKEIKYSSARDLRRQLSEIAPMNDEGSKIFCPNGPSAAVSPMMENKCSDRQALPSVYGRNDDALGNSVPGFGGTTASALRAELNAQAYFRDWIILEFSTWNYVPDDSGHFCWNWRTWKWFTSRHTRHRFFSHVLVEASSGVARVIVEVMFYVRLAGYWIAMDFFGVQKKNRC